MSTLIELDKSEAFEQRQAYRRAILPKVAARWERARQGKKHPVHDFLFEYYSYRPGLLLKWTPGAQVVLKEQSAGNTDWPRHFRDGIQGCHIPISLFPTSRLDTVHWTVAYLQKIQEREPHLSCLGLHEWAMVYRTPRIRHDQIPLRLSAEEVQRVVESFPLTCTHYDAFRFFTEAARPRNRWPLTRLDTPNYDQPGCIHVIMDLYKWTYKVAPFIASTLLLQAFELAWQARELDMRASPYDLARFGYDPIRIETREGREEYLEEQKKLVKQSLPVRKALLGCYERLLQALKQPAVQDDEP